MADAPNTSSALIVAFVLCLCVANAFSAFTCADGVYWHEGRKCCRCAIGKRVLKHCTTDLQYGICEECQNGTYSSVPNGQTDCELCTSCTQINANQVENTTCVSSTDRTCRCKEDHFCPGSTGTCKVCNPCTKCGAEGVKVACKGNNDTICNEKNEGHSHVGIAIGVVAGVICVAALAGIGVFLYKRRQRGSKDISDQCRNENEDEAASFIPEEGDLEPLFPDLVKVIGWKDMRDIALRSRLSNTEIESCKISYPTDANEQTLALLRIWNEKQGRGAGNKLKQMLQDAGKKRKAEEVTKILLRSARNNSPV